MNTPGPWEVEAGVRLGHYHLLNYGHDAIASRSFDGYAEQHEANRALIEAAPELLEYVKAHDDQQARALVAKALGYTEE